MGHEVHEVEPSFKAAVAPFMDVAVAALMDVTIPDPEDHTAWHYVQVVDQRSVDAWWSGNNGSQGWWHKKTGYTIPDFCRQQGGCPEVWTRQQLEESDQVIIAHDSPIIAYMIPYEGKRITSV